MLFGHLYRGGVAGAVGGIYYGSFVLLVGTPMVRLAERFETGAGGGSQTLLGAGASVAGGLLWGVTLGFVVFGIAFYLLEPAIPGPAASRSYLLGAAGFLTVSGAPWLVLPPQPPGVEAALPTGVRLLVYGGMALAGAIASGLAGSLYHRLRRHGLGVAVVGGVAPMVLLGGLAAVVPAVSVSSQVPGALVEVFRWTVVFGQVSLWIVLASAHTALSDTDPVTAAGEFDSATDPAGP